MVYIFGLAIVLIAVVLFWCTRAIILAIYNKSRRPDAEGVLPPPVTQPSLSDTAETVFGRFMAGAMVEMHDPVPPPVARRRSSVYSGVVRAHPECGSDPELPKYSPDPTASRPELIVLEDDNLPPPLTPLTPRSRSPVSDPGVGPSPLRASHRPRSGSGSSTPSTASADTHPSSSSRPTTPPTPTMDPGTALALGISSEAPEYTTRPSTPVMSVYMTAEGSHVTFAPGAAIVPPTHVQPPPQARRKHNQRGPASSSWMFVTPL